VDVAAKPLRNESDESVAAHPQDKIKELMGRDPKFITRLIGVSPAIYCLPLPVPRSLNTWCCCFASDGKSIPLSPLSCLCDAASQQLDKQMHGMMRDKQRRLAQIAADKMELARLDAQIANNVQVVVVDAAAAVVVVVVYIARHQPIRPWFACSMRTRKVGALL
jgi:hypothetical protein